MELPENVYKYRVWKNGSHKNLLLHNELYLASPKDINDPFDCRIPPNYKNLTVKEKDKYANDIALKVKLQGLNISENDIKDFKNGINNTEKFQKDAEKIIFEFQDKHYGILSFSKRWNGILLWSHYADCHKGFCVGFSTEKLWKTGLFDKAELINYDKTFPKVKPFVAKDEDKDKNEVVKIAFVQTHTKSADWTYEEEFRFLKVFPYGPKPLERIVYVPDHVFSDVTIGINTSDEDKAEIIEICNGKKIPVYQAKKKGFLFEIDRVQITFPET